MTKFVWANPIMLFFYRTTRYCIDCLNRFIKFVNKNGYIVCAITSNWFCTSAWRAFTLIAANKATFVITGSMGFIFNWIGKCFIAFLTTGIGALFIVYIPALDKNVSAPFFVYVLIFIGAYMVSATFISMFSFAMDTILMCFLIDETLSGNGKPGKHRPSELDGFAARNELTRCCCGCCC